MSTSTTTVAEDTLRAKLHNAGYKATPARLAILSVLQKSKKPLNVQNIMALLKDKTIDQATVYRNMNALTGSGLVLQIDFQRTHAFYELANKEDHHHAVCTKCQQVQDVHGCELDHMTRKALRQSGFAAINNHSLEFFGICKNCQ